MTQDSKLIDYLNHKEGLYDALLEDLSLSKKEKSSLNEHLLVRFYLAATSIALNSS